MYYTLMIFLVCLLLISACAQRPSDGTSDACNVNVMCQCGDSETSSTPKGPVLPGPPGKRGQRGEIGQRGLKGETGARGQKGQKGNNDESQVKADVLNALGAASCDELATNHDVSTSGYYLMRDSVTNTPVYKYCDFRVYSDIASCDELVTTDRITKSGYFRFGRTNDDRRNFRFCEPVFRGVYTCERLQALHQVTESGFYRFITGEPFRVYCNFTSGTAVTEVWHNLMKEMQIPDCEDPGCYSGMPLYDASASGLRLIVGNSASCKQFLKLRCRGVVMDWEGSPRAWWTSKDGAQMRYWAGASRNGYCACGETNTCIDNSHKCNCNQNSDNVVTSDEGYVTDKTKLPIKEVRVGDMGGATEVAWHTIGKLECIGQV